MSFLDNARLLGAFVCPHQDGDYDLTVKDMAGWATGSCLIEQKGQGEEHSLMLTKEEAAKLASILFAFASEK